MLRYIAIAFLFLFISLKMYGQVNIQYVKGGKTNYNIGDTVVLSVRIKAPEETCIDGMKTTKLFQKGISIINQSEWQEIKKGLWQTTISLIIKGNKKKEAILTIFRRNDKQSISHQEQFKYITQ